MTDGIGIICFIVACWMYLRLEYVIMLSTCYCKQGRRLAGTTTKHRVTPVIVIVCSMEGMHCKMCFIQGGS
jgi:hypothetical protein